jgi:transcriptional regulator of NAD metabolism
LELVLNQLAEATTTELSKVQEPDGFGESVQVARQGGSIVGDTRKAIESASGRPVITSKNAVDFTKVIGSIIGEIENGHRDAES